MMDIITLNITYLEQTSIESGDGKSVMDAPGLWMITPDRILTIENIKLARQFADWLDQSSILATSMTDKNVFAKLERRLRDRIKEIIRKNPGDRCESCGCVKCICVIKRCKVCKTKMTVLGVLAWCDNCKEHYEVA
jgi:hypothetical protein